MDRDAGLLTQPRLHDRVQVASLRHAQAHDQLVAGVAALAADRRAASLSGCHYPKTVGLPAIPEWAAVAERAQSFELLALSGLVGEVPAEPGLAFGNERLREPFGLASVSGGPGGHGNDCHLSGIDRHPEMPRPRRSPERAFEAAACELQRGAPFRRRCHPRKGSATPAPGRGRSYERMGRRGTRSRRPASADRGTAREPMGAIWPNPCRATAPRCCNIRRRVGL